MIVSPVPGRAPLLATGRTKSASPLPSTAAFECDRHVGPSAWLVHEGEDVAIREGLPFELGQPLIGPPPVVRHRRAVQASQVLDPTAALRVLQDPRMMLGEEPLRIQDADVWRPSEPSLRATLVAGLVLPADLHLLFTLHFCPSTTRWGKPRDSGAPPPIASAMSLAVVNRCFGSNAIARVTTSESDRGTLGTRSRGDRYSSVLPCASCFMEP